MLSVRSSAASRVSRNVTGVTSEAVTCGGRAHTRGYSNRPLWQRVQAGWPTGLGPSCFAPRIWMGARWRPERPFISNLNLFDTDTPAIAYLVLTFAQLAREGLGPGRRKVELLNVEQLDEPGQPVPAP